MTNFTVYQYGYLPPGNQLQDYNYSCLSKRSDKHPVYPETLL